MKKTEKMIHQNIRFRSRIDTFLVSIEEFPSPSRHNDYGNAMQCNGNVVLQATYLLDRYLHDNTERAMTARCCCRPCPGF